MIWVVGPGSYGRNDADDCRHGRRRAGQGGRQAGAPAIHARRRAPAGTRRARPRSTAPAPRSTPPATSSPTSSSARASRASTCNTNGSKPLGHARRPLPRRARCKSGDGFGVPAESYEFANKRMAWETIPPLLDRASPLRSAHLRDPVGPQIHFASESFMDEVAAALDVDPIEFRLRHVKDPRDIAVIKAAAEKAGWQSRPSPRKDQTGNKVSGRGIAYSQRNGTALRHRRRGRGRPHDRQDLGAQVHRRARLRPDHQSRTASSRPSRATSCRA